MNFVAWTGYCTDRCNKHFVSYFTIVGCMYHSHVGVLHPSIEFLCHMLTNSLKHAFFLFLILL